MEPFMDYLQGNARATMDDDGLSLGDSPMDPSDSAGELAQASLQSYINSVPYECEAPEVMQARLEEIVGKISICAKSQNWLVLTTWDGMLQWCGFSLPLHYSAYISPVGC